MRPTRAGAGFVVMLGVLGVVAANPGLNLMLLLFGLGVGVLLFNAAVSRRHVHAVEVRRMLPDVAAAGRPTVIRYQITNRSSRITARSLWVLEEPGEPLTEPAVPTCYIHAAAPSTAVTAETRLVPLRRGWLRLRVVRLTSRFPFGLLERLRRVPIAEQLLVWPALWQPRFDWLGRAARAPQSRQAHSPVLPSGADEFIGIREYRPGDNTRWIHWRRSAAMDRVLVREMADPSPGHVTLALETVGADGPAVSAVLESLVSATASLACDALERGWHVGLILNGQPRVTLPPAGGSAMRRRILYELATVAPAGRHRLADLLASWPGGAAWAGCAILLQPGAAEAEDPAVRSAATQLLAGIGRVRVLSPQDLGTWFDMASVPLLDAAAAAGRSA